MILRKPTENLELLIVVYFVVMIHWLKEKC